MQDPKDIRAWFRKCICVSSQVTRESGNLGGLFWERGKEAKLGTIQARHPRCVETIEGKAGESERLKFKETFPVITVHLDGNS